MSKVGIKKKYQKLYTTDKRYIIVTGGRGSGKSYAIRDLSVRLLEQKGQGILFTRYTMVSVEKTVIKPFLQHIERISDLSRYHIANNIITNKETGSFIMFSGIKTSSGDQTANLKSLPDITTWVIEEGEDFNSEKTFEDIDDSIRSKHLPNRVIWIQNPSTRHHFIFQKFFLDTHVRVPVREGITMVNNEGKVVPITYQRSTHPHVEHIHTTYFDNLEHIDQLKIELWDKALVKNPKKWANKYGGAWVDMPEGVIFDAINWIEDFPKDVKRISWGMDFGFTKDPTTLVKCGVSDGELFAKQYIYSTGMTTKDIHAALKDIGVKRTEYIYCDSADPKTIKELRLLGWKTKGAVKGSDSIRSGIDKIKTYEALNIVRCKFWKEEQIGYIWTDKSDSKGRPIPSKDFNHLWDALRYGIQGLRDRTAKTNIR